MLDCLDLQEAEVWVTAHQTEIPDPVYSGVFLLTKLRSEMVLAHQRAANLLALFRQELGITPKSESGSPSI